MNKNVIIIGASGHGKVIADIVCNSNDNIVGFHIYAFAEITHDPTKIFHVGKIADVDPVTKNGSKDNTPVTDATNGVYYQNNQGATFTMTFTSDKAVDAVLFLDMTSTNNKAYAVSSILTSITVNGVEVDLNDVGTITTKNWNAANDVKATLAVFSLKEGTNTITFVFGSNNINISGIQLLAACDITFSKN